MHALTTVETVHEDGSWLFTVQDRYGEREEVILVPCDESVEHSSASSQRGNRADDSEEHGSTSSRPAADDGVEAWINRCTHEAQRFDTGRGVPMRDGQIICPRHGSLFDSCSGYCDNGEAVDTTLRSIDITVHGDGTVFLTDDDATFVHEGGLDDDGGPDSTSHISL